MNSDELEVAKLAAITSSELKKIDSSMMERNIKGGPANRIDPRRFLSNMPNQPNNTRIINNSNIIQAPKSTPAGTEVVGTEAVNIRDLLIPIPEDLKETVKQKVYIGGSRPIGPAYIPPVTSGITPNYLESRLNDLEKKLNKVIKGVNKILKLVSHE